MARETSIIIPVVPQLDDRATQGFWKDIKKLQKDLKKVDVGFKNTSKTAAQNVQQLRQMSKSAESFGKTLSSGAASVYKNLGKLSDKLEKEQEKAAKAIRGKTKAKAAGKDTKEFDDAFAEAAAGIVRLNQQVEIQRNAAKKFTSELNKASEAQTKYSKQVKQLASYDAAGGFSEGLKNMFSGSSSGLKSGVVGVMGSIGKGIQGALAKNLMKKHESAVASGDAGGVASAAFQMKMLAGSAATMAAAAAGIAVFVNLLVKASSHMTNLNKAMGAGEGFASEMGAKTGEYTQTLKNMRDAAMDAHGAMLKYGLDSEKSLQIVGAFSKQASGSVIKTAAQLKKLGDGDLQSGLFKMATQAQLYGKALGMQATEVASMMGDLVSEVGMNSDQVLGTIGDVVKQASQANMPLTKFSEIFRQAVPNLDLFTNRIEEVTGMVKLMSKTMDPKGIKNFMNAFGKGFEQLDFKQRLKMALVVGPGEMGKIMQKDMDRAGKSVKNSLPDSLKGAFDDAMKGKGSLTELAAKASMQGVQGTTVANIKKLERMRSLSKGGVLKQATGMREMGMLGRMEALEKYAGRFTGGDITGLGEHVAKQLGVSESEYQAILDLKASMQTQMSALNKYGRTGSKSINDNLKKMYKGDQRAAGMNLDSDEEFEKFMKTLAKNDPKGLEESVKIASTMQVSEAEQKAKDDEKAAASLEDIGIEQVNATISLGDKVENVIGMLLEKLWYVLDEVLRMLGSIYDFLPNFMTGKKESAAATMLRSSSKDAGKFGLTEAGKKSYIQTNSQMASMLEAGADTKKLMNTFGGDLLKVMGKSDAEQRAIFANAFDGKDLDKFMKASQEADVVTTDKMLKELDPEKAAKLLSAAAFSSAKDMKDFDPGAKKETKKTELMSKKMLAAKAEMNAGDVDWRSLEQGLQDSLAKASTPEDKAAVQKEIDDMNKKKAEAEASKSKNDEASKKKEAEKADPSAIAAAVATAPAAATQPSSSPAVKNADAVTKSTEIQGDIQKTGEESVKKAEEQYEKMSDTLSLLKKGVKLEKSWMSREYKYVVMKAVEDGVKGPLLDQIILYAKIWDDKELREAYASDPESVRKLGLGSKELDAISGTESGEALKKAAALKVPSYDDGGGVARGGLALLHAGESVVTNKGTGGKTVNMGGVTINVTTDATAEQIAAALHNQASRQ